MPMAGAWNSVQPASLLTLISVFIWVMDSLAETAQTSRNNGAAVGLHSYLSAFQGNTLRLTSLRSITRLET